MEFKDPDNHFAFILITTMLFLGIATYLLMFNYFDVPKISNDHTFIFGIDNYDYPFKQDFNWNVSFNDRVISNFENIIIWIFFLWGLLRLIDLFRFLVNYKKE